MEITLIQVVKYRHQKMMETIAEWENEKKVKARRKKERKKSFFVIHGFKKCIVTQYSYL
jgi:hypothetical protein